MPRQVILVTGASRGFGRLSAKALAHSGNTVYASMRGLAGRNAAQAKEVLAYAEEQGIDLRALELDVTSDASVDLAVSRIIEAHGRLDVIVHSAGQRAFGPAEAFTPGQLAELFDVNVLSTQRVNRAALPFMRQQRQGLLVWVSASGVAGGTLPYLAPYLAAKAGMDALAVHYARELVRWGIETSIVVPGIFTRGTSPYALSQQPADTARAAVYEAGPYADIARQIRGAFDRIVPDDADPAQVAGAIAGVVDAPFGERPFRVHVDPSDDGASIALAVSDRVRAEMLHRAGFTDLLTPHPNEAHR
ncbi:MAG: SDR family oxidoreductase [Reyranella sp.]|uniref:SDR family oxidoreductase n=1 Tax=Reyranella sp. TaxID=1929291 RepID=UPI003D09D9CE